jgi:hypothetical protein
MRLTAGIGIAAQLAIRYRNSYAYLCRRRVPGRLTTIPAAKQTRAVFAHGDCNANGNDRLV